MKTPSHTAASSLIFVAALEACGGSARPRDTAAPGPTQEALSRSQEKVRAKVMACERALQDSMEKCGTVEKSGIFGPDDGKLACTVESRAALPQCLNDAGAGALLAEHCTPMEAVEGLCKKLFDNINEDLCEIDVGEQLKKCESAAPGNWYDTANAQIASSGD